MVTQKKYQKKYECGHIHWLNFHHYRYAIRTQKIVKGDDGLQKKCLTQLRRVKSSFRAITILYFYIQKCQ